MTLFARDENSGTWDTFESLVLKANGPGLSSSADRYESSQELSDRVSATPGAIGFIGLPYVRQSKLLAVTEGRGALPVYPTSFTVSTEDYPLARRLFLYLPATSANRHARAFVDFAIARSGQQVVRDVGLVSQNEAGDIPHPGNRLWRSGSSGVERLTPVARPQPPGGSVDNLSAESGLSEGINPDSLMEVKPPVWGSPVAPRVF